MCRVNDGGSDLGGGHERYGGSSIVNSKVTLDLEHLGLIPVAVPSTFTIRVAGGDDAELAVSVQGEYLLHFFGYFNSGCSDSIKIAKFTTVGCLRHSTLLKLNESWTMNYLCETFPCLAFMTMKKAHAFSPLADCVSYHHVYKIKSFKKNEDHILLLWKCKRWEYSFWFYMPTFFDWRKFFGF